MHVNNRTGQKVHDIVTYWQGHTRSELPNLTVISKSYGLPTQHLQKLSSLHCFCVFSLFKKQYDKLPAAHSRPPMSPQDYFHLARCRDIVSQRQILSKHGIPPTTPVEVVIDGISQATTFYKTLPGFPVDGHDKLSMAVVVSGSPLPVFNGVYSAVLCDGVYAYMCVHTHLCFDLTTQPIIKLVEMNKLPHTATRILVGN